MALAYDAKSSDSANDAYSCTFSHTCSGADRLLVLGVSVVGPALGVADHVSATYEGVAMTQVGTKYTGVTNADVAIALFYLVAPALGAHDVIVSSMLPTAIVAGATSWTGADQSTPVGSFVSASGTSTAPTVDASSASGEYVLDVVGGAGSGALTQGAGQTERWDTTATQPPSTIRGAGSQEGGAETVTMSWTLGSSERWAIGAIPIKPGEGGPGSGETAATEIWVIPARPEPFAIAEGYDGLLAQALASRFPHLLAWKATGAGLTWHDLGWLPAHAQLDAIAAGSVAPGTGVDPGLTLFGVEAHDGIVLTSLGSSAMGASQRRFADPGGVVGTDSGVLFGSRVEFNEPHRLLAIRVWGEDFQAADTLRFAYRWNRRRWYSLEFHGVPTHMGITGSESGLSLEWVIGFTDKYAWEPSLPVITRLEAQVEPVEQVPTPEPDTQIPEVD